MIDSSKNINGSKQTKFSNKTSRSGQRYRPFFRKTQRVRPAKYSIVLACVSYDRSCLVLGVTAAAKLWLVWLFVVEALLVGSLLLR